jgi:hypothetical protein
LFLIFFQTYQTPGQFILTYPAAYHQVANTGNNCAEACNISTPQWLEHGLFFKKCYKVQKKDDLMTDGAETPTVPVAFMLWPNLRSVRAFVAYLHGNLLIPQASDGTIGRVPAPGLQTMVTSLNAWKNMPYKEWLIKEDEFDEDRSSYKAFTALQDHINAVNTFQVSVIDSNQALND